MIIRPDAAVLASGMVAAELLKLPRWRAALSSSAAGSPLLVHRLDRTDSDYYIVPFVNRTAVTARLNIDAVSGRLNEAAGIEEAGDSLPPYVNADGELKTSADGTVELTSVSGRIIRTIVVVQDPVVVWRPCRESMSAFKPFYLLSAGDEFVYLRVDGRRFTQLTIGPA